ncbi:methyltransferase domain-containing protein [Microcoleus sp. S28C3]|uniref:methyltransferase domain-containing protein n=1 Tax=Microcoleus sp. S28C3 TaxID=3055414 RepID=UPI002FD65E93
MNQLYNSDYTDPLIVQLYDLLNPFSKDSQFYLELASNPSVSTVLDIGCGTGVIAIEISKKQKKVVGIDPSEAMINIAKSKYSSKNLQWVVGDISNTPLYKFDCIFMAGHASQVFLTETMWTSVLMHSYFSLNPGGILAFETLNPILKPWEQWKPSFSKRTIFHQHLGQVDVWYDIISFKEKVAYYNTYYDFKTNNRLITTKGAKIFREKEEIISNLSKIGFRIKVIYGNWDLSLDTKEGKELIFIATK